MSGAGQISTTRKVYRYKAWLRVISAFFGTFFAVGGAAILIDAAFLHTTRSSIPVAFAAMPLGMAFYLIAVTFRPRIIIDGPCIEVRGIFTDRAASLSEIEGIRSRPSRYGNLRQLLLKDGGSPITLRSSFSVDDDYRAWMQQVPDLDVRDRDALLAQIEQSEELGATPEERLGALASARQKNIALAVLIGIAALGFDVGSGAWVQPCGVAVALAPILTAWMCWRSPLLFAVFKRKQDPRAETSYGLLIAAFALLIHMGPFHLLSFEPLLPGMALLGVVMVAANYRAALTGYGNRVLFVIVLLAALYAYGTLGMMNICFDSSAGDPYSTTVVGMHESHGRSTTYYLRLAPWGPVPFAQDVSVSSSLYRATSQGDSVCLMLHPGRLKAPWFRMINCSASQ